jgi:APA family basic amino acid/polyamine antiporter
LDTVIPEMPLSEIRAKAYPAPLAKDSHAVSEVKAPQFVQGMGLFSATAIVMGSMIGSGW